MRKHLRWAVLALVFALVAAACGGDDGGDTTAAGTEAPPAETEAPATDAPTEDRGPDRDRGAACDPCAGRRRQDFSRSRRL